MTLEESLFAVDVLRTPLAETYTDDGEAVTFHRKVIRDAYEHIKQSRRELSFADASRLARAEWLTGFVNNREESRK